MKKIILTITLIITGLNAQSQDVIDTFGKEIFECTFSKVKSANETTDEQLESFLTNCTKDSYNNQNKEIATFFKNEVTFEEFSEEVYGRLTTKFETEKSSLVNNTKSVISTIIKPKQTTNATKSIIDVVQPKKTTTPDETIKKVVFTNLQCTVTKVIDTKYLTLVVIDDKGNMKNFIYHKPFPTDILLRNNRIITGDRLIINYEEVELFDNETQRDVKYLQITQLRLKK